MISCYVVYMPGPVISQATDNRQTDILSMSDPGMYMSRHIFIYESSWLYIYIHTSCSVATVAADLEHCDQCDSCMATALTTGVISAINTALLVAVISVVVHFTVYECVYKVKPRFINTDGKPESRGGDATVYDVVDERVGTTLEMKQNEAYGVAKSRGNN